MRTKPMIVSFYTPNYAEEALRMVDSVIRFHLPLRVKVVESRGQWLDNVYYRAEFIEQMLNWYQGPVVWIDIDAELLRFPDLFVDFKGDFGAHYLDWPVSEHYPNGFHELLGGTMYFAYNEKVLELVRNWIRLNQEMPKQKRSQLVLQRAVKEWTGQVVELPAAYTYIRRLMPGVKDPVIEHYQASAKYRRPELEGFDDVAFV